MSRKKREATLIGIVIASVLMSIAAIIGMTSTARAATGAQVVGSYHVVDNGQGCWTGGGLLSDGTATDESGGACSFFIDLPGGVKLHEQLKFTSKTWTYDPGTNTATLCATVAPTHAGSDPAGIAPNLGCTPPIPVNVGPVEINGTNYKVDLKR